MNRVYLEKQGHRENLVSLGRTDILAAGAYLGQRVTEVTWVCLVPMELQEYRVRQETQDPWGHLA